MFSYLFLSLSTFIFDKVLAFLVVLGLVDTSWLKSKSLGQKACFFLLGALENNQNGREKSSSTPVTKAWERFSYSWEAIATIGEVVVTMTWIFSRDDSLGLGPVSIMNLSNSSNMVANTSNKFGKVEKIFLMLSWGVSKADSLILVEGTWTIVL